MRRPIIFRAKDIVTGVWRYGFITQGHTAWYIKNEKLGVWEVDIKTLGQYIGLQDRNRLPIYEGDIVLKDNDERHWIVEYNEQGACFYFKCGHRYLTISECAQSKHMDEDIVLDGITVIPTPSTP